MTRAVVPVLAAILAVTLVVPAAAQVAMPDPAQMSGLPLPAPELPDATVTVRLVRERMGNNVPGHEVTLITPDGRASAVTDAEGRAQFTAVPAGARVTAEATIDGETLRSQEFPVPARGGVRVALVAGVAKAAAATAAARAEAAAAPARPGAVVFGPDTRVILEFQDDLPTVFYLFNVVNNARTPVDTGKPLVLDLPPDAAGASLVAGPATLARMEDRRLTLTGPFPPGSTGFQVAYRLPIAETIRLEAGLAGAGRGPAGRRREGRRADAVVAAADRDARGRVERPDLRHGHGRPARRGPAVRAGSSRACRRRRHGRAMPRSALPACSHSGRRGPSGRGALTRMRAATRWCAERERLLGAIAAIDAERRARGAADPRASAKRERLVAAAEQVYAELDRLPGGAT